MADRSSVSERLRAVVQRLEKEADKHDESASVMFAEHDSMGGHYREGKAEGKRDAARLLDALLSAEVPASTDEGLRERLLEEARIWEPSPLTLLLREAAVALPSPPTPAAPQLGQDWVSRTTNDPSPDVSVIGAQPTPAPLTQEQDIRAHVASVIACAERDCVVNPQSAGGLQPVIALLREAVNSPVSTPPEQATKQDHWCVSVERNHENLVTIESNMLAGKPDFSAEDEQCIRDCAQHLLSFIGAIKGFAAPPEQAGAPYDPRLICPQCGQDNGPDCDGFGFSTQCKQCGFCAHLSLTGDVCDVCGHNSAEQAGAGAAPTRRKPNSILGGKAVPNSTGGHCHVVNGHCIICRQPSPAAAQREGEQP